MIFRKKKKLPENEINLKTPIWRIVITVFISMLVLSGYFIISSRITAVINFAEKVLAQMQAQSREAYRSVSKSEVEQYLQLHGRKNIPSPTDAFIKNTRSALQSIRPLGDLQEDSVPKGLYSIHLVAEDSLGTYLIASSDSARKYGEAIKYRLKKDSIEKVHLILYSTKDQNDSLHKKFAYYKPLTYQGKSAGILITPNVQFIEKDALSAIKGGIKVALAVFFITFFILFFSLRKVLKREQKIKTTLHESKRLIEHKNQEITDSITYAKRIQQAILPSVDLIYQTLKQSFILYKPKDVVSGDFYAFAERKDLVIVAAVDCTGHGVPGAFMSMIGHNLLSEIIAEQGITKPSIILEELNKAIRKALKQSENNTKDGMDAAVIAFNLSNHTLQYAGANRPLWLVRNGLLDEIKATKLAIGGHTTNDQVFVNHDIALQKGDTIYLFSDGYTDQFGGPIGKKFMSKQFKETLVGMQHLDMRTQGSLLDSVFEDWKGKNDQVDDVLVIGVRV